MNNLLVELFAAKGKTILITGANGQLGSKLAESFIACGANVVGTDLKLPETSNRIPGVDYYELDISKEEDVKTVFNRVFEKYSGIDALINNAGVAVFSPYLERTEEDLDFVIDVNLKGTFYCIKNYVSLFEKIEMKRGSIVNIASIFGVVSPDFRNYTDCARNSSEIYGATKAGVVQMTKYFATHLARKNIRVNSISPGGLLNESNPQGEEFQANYSFRCPMGRMGLVSEMVGAAIYLVGKGSSYTTGQNIVIDGGMSSW